MVVAADAEGRGVGRTIYEELLAVARDHNATLLDGSVRDDMPAALAWHERRGFFIRHHGYLSELEVAQVDIATFREHPRL